MAKEASETGADDQALRDESSRIRDAFGALRDRGAVLARGLQDAARQVAQGGRLSRESLQAPMDDYEATFQGLEDALERLERWLPPGVAAAPGAVSALDDLEARWIDVSRRLETLAAQQVTRRRFESCGRLLDRLVLDGDPQARLLEQARFAWAFACRRWEAEPTLEHETILAAWEAIQGIEREERAELGARFERILAAKDWRLMELATAALSGRLAYSAESPEVASSSVRAVVGAAVEAPVETTLEFPVETPKTTPEARHVGLSAASEEAASEEAASEEAASEPRKEAFGELSAEGESDEETGVSATSSEAREAPGDFLADAPAESEEELDGPSGLAEGEEAEPVVTSPQNWQDYLSGGADDSRLASPAAEEAGLAAGETSADAESADDRAAIAVEGRPDDAAPRWSAEASAPAAGMWHRADRNASAATIVGQWGTLAGDQRGPALRDLAWCLLRDGREALAWHLTRYLDANATGELSGELSSAMVAAVAAGRQLVVSSGPATELSDEALRRAEQETSRESLPHPEATGLLLFAASLQGAFVGQESRALSILRTLRLPPRFEPLSVIQQLAVRFREDQHLVLTAGLLRGDDLKESWQRAIDDLTSRCEAWLSQMRDAKLIFQATTQVWRHWLRFNQPLGQMLRIISQHDVEQRERVERTLREWEHDVEKRLRATDLELRGVGASRKPIEARALVAVRQCCNEALDFARSWLRLLATRPTEESSWIARKCREFRALWNEAYPAAKRCMEEYGGAPDVELPKHAAAVAVLRTLEGVARVFSGATSGSPGGLAEESEPGSRRWNTDLLRTRTRVRLTDDWTPTEPASGETLQAILEAVIFSDESWTGLLRAAWSAGDFAKAGCILEILGAVEPSKADRAVAALREEHEQRFAEHVRGLRQRREDLYRRVQVARLRGVLEEPDRLGLTEELEAWGGSPADFDEACLQSIESRFATLKTARLEGARSRLLALQSRGVSPATAARIAEMLKCEDLLTANEYLVLAEQGAEIPTSEAARPGTDFYPVFYERVGDRVFFGQHRTDLRHIAEQVGGRVELAGLNLKKLLTPGEATVARDILNGWRKIQAHRELLPTFVQQLFKFLGFRVRSSQSISGGTRPWFEVQAETLDRRADCPLPDFGSRANGKYYVVFVDGSPLEERLLKDTTPPGGGRQRVVIALFWDYMSARRRSDLARTLRQHPSRRLLVLDGVMLFYLCLQRSRPLAFFNAACAFSPADPYSTTASLVPTEMFFGRSDEIERVVNPRGANLVYGGRQLGKTALLREVQRRYHRPADGFLVQWIDLRYGERLGQGRPMDDIWQVIVSRLYTFGVTQASTRRPQAVEAEILDWLSKNPDRHVVLLLDEADEFLRSDAREGWPRVGQLKSLMDKSDRRFKVVFCGLHNVQRTSHDSNTPIAHFEEAICIGPFLSRDDLRDAMAMIEQPFSAMGYRFESHDLIARVLAHTNYYPSLIQLFCRQLLVLLTHSGASFDKDSPPYVIRQEHIDDAFAERSLQSQIRERFRWTLELDNRYRVIALCIGLESSEDPESIVTGYSLSEIREWALGAWPRGFADCQGRDEFRSLLLEMVDLGVLRETRDGRYAMRSPNVIGLMGTSEDLLHALEDAARASPEAQYEAASFRRVFDDQRRWRRSPLTALQESLLLDPQQKNVFLIEGAVASGLDEVQPFLRQFRQPHEASDVHFEEVADCRDATEFHERLRQLLAARDAGITWILVTRECPWTEEWVGHAVDELRRRHAEKRRFAKVLFLTGPAEVWRWLAVPEDLRRKLENGGLIEMSLHRWTADVTQAWKKEAEFGVENPGDLVRFQQATGLWCHFLHEVGQQCVDRPHEWETIVTRYAQSLTASDAALSKFELVPDSHAVLRALADYGEPVTLADLEILTEERAPAWLARRVLEWAERLRFIERGSHESWTLDPFLQRLLVHGDHGT